MAQDTFPPISDTAAFDLQYTMNDGVAVVDAQNRLWVHKDFGWSTADLIATANDIRDAWNTNVAPIVQTEMTLHTVLAKNWDNVLNPVITVDVTDSTGTLAGDPIPFTSCAIVRYFTDGVDPTQCYIRHGGMVETQVDGQHMSVAAQTAIAAAWEAVRVAINDADHDQVCVSVYQPDPVGDDIFKDAGTINNITSLTVRRRLGRSASRQK